ncbi:hypothetical protein FE411_06720 [Leuconostoc mesenteroides]|uniref:hypothetical protein n=1 Tax=Leuconostoc mesenteroides TaxID=1245 RepID=UPI0012398409|nr:hypothetical protein [Leuconostoc mesenteroides]KAA8346328.1 hypothetical protein FE411_06720 [Leuconostoc mesenteroides]
MKFKTFYFLMQLIFVIGKMLGLIAWSWWIVFLPIWLPIAVIVLFGAIGSVSFDNKGK